MQKKDLRSRYKNLRNALTEDALLNASLSIANRALQLPESLWKFDFYHLFLSITENKEVDTSFLLSVLQGRDKNVVLPKVVNENELTHFLLTDSTRISKNKWNIPEPVDGIEIKPRQIDVIFIPLLAFDHMGNRIGYGKGFYDRFLSQCRPESKKIGLSLFEAESEVFEAEDTDVPLDYCVTPNQIYSFEV